LAAFAWVAKLD
jgi:hypothetical protein